MYNEICVLFVFSLLSLKPQNQLRPLTTNSICWLVVPVDVHVFRAESLNFLVDYLSGAVISITRVFFYSPIPDTQECLMIIYAYRFLLCLFVTAKQWPLIHLLAGTSKNVMRSSLVFRFQSGFVCVVGEYQSARDGFVCFSLVGLLIVHGCF